MFGQMMHGIAQDFVRYVMHVQVVQQVEQAPAPVVQNVQTHSSEDVAQGATAMQQTAVTAGGGNGDEQGAAAPTASAEPVATMKPVVKSEWEKTPRNAPCPCGSGKKYKMCHGK